MVCYHTSGRKERTTYNAEGEQTFMKFENLNVFLCIQGLAHWGKDVQVTAAEFHDTMVLDCLLLTIRIVAVGVYSVYITYID